MSQRLIIKAGGGSPLRFAASGADAAGAAFSDLLFDANQAPLRYMQSGFSDINIMPPELFTVPWQGSNDIPLAQPPPAGKYNMFVVEYQTYLPTLGFGGIFGARHGPSGTAGNPFGTGFGGISRGGVFNCLSWAHDPTGTAGGQFTRIYYLIFRNYW